MPLVQMMLVLLLWLPMTPSTVRAAEERHTRVELVCGQKSIQPGDVFTVALRMSMDKGWHTYWRNPGDSGLPTELEWDLPEGFVAGELQWPVPEEIGSEESLSYGYENEVLLLCDLHAPESLIPGDKVTLKATATWLECQEACLPQETGLSLRLKVRDEAPRSNKRWAKAIAAAAQTVPVPATGWTLTAQQTEQGYRIEGVARDGSRLPEHLRFLPGDGGIIDHGAAQTLTLTPGGFTLDLRRSVYATEAPDRLQGILVAGDSREDSSAAHGMSIDLELTHTH